MRYTEHEPRGPLRQYVHRMWTLRGLGDGAPERVVPDGRPEIIVNAGDRFRRLDGSACGRAQEEILVVGQLGRAIRILATGTIDLFGVRFEAAGLHALLGIPMHELADRDQDLRSVSRSLGERIGDACRSGPESERIAGVERVIWEAIERGAIGGRRQEAAGDAVRRLEGGGVATVSGVASLVGVSPRTLERAFREEIGLSPKRYLRVRRLAGVVGDLDALGRRAFGGWAAMAAAHGFADQSHLVREFRSIAGVTPSAYLREQTRMSDCFLSSPESRSSKTEG